MSVTFKDIEHAAKQLKGNVVRTPLVFSPRLSELTGAKIYLKLENFQETNSFKDRGAYIRLSALSADERKRGVVAMSAGNHAQAVALHAKNLNIPAVIVMPKTSPFTKLERTRDLGAEVLLVGETLDDCRETVEDLIEKRGLTLIHPFDHDLVIAGQGSVGLEMLADCPNLDMLVVPIGGGGLISGMAIAAKHIKPEIEIHGVEAVLYPSMYEALHEDHPIMGGVTLADGLAVKKASQRTIDICRGVVKEVHLVEEMYIERAVNAYLSQQKIVVEGAGASGLAAILKNPEPFKGKKVGLVVCGGNIDTRILASIIYRELERDFRIVNLSVIISDRPGILGDISTLLGEHGANILEVSHKRMLLDVSAKGAQLELMMEVRDKKHATDIKRILNQQGYVISILASPGGKVHDDA